MKALIGLVLFSFVFAKSAPVMTLDELVRDLGDVNILDSREKEEFDVSHIKGAVYIGYKNFDITSALAKIDKTKPTVVYCSVGYRSGKIVQRLRAAGVKALNLENGIFGWVNAGHKVYTAVGPTNEVHGYNSNWAKKVKKGKVVTPKEKKWFFF